MPVRSRISRVVQTLSLWDAGATLVLLGFWVLGSWLRRVRLISSEVYR